MTGGIEDKKAKEIEKLLSQGEQLLNKLDFPAAAAKFNKVIKLNPDDPRGYFNRAEAFIGIPKKGVKEIVSLYEKAIELDPNNPLYYARLGGFCLDNGLFRRAEEAYRKAADTDPENSYLYYSEFAIELYYSTRRLFDDMDEEISEKVSIISLYYLLRALKMSKKRAAQLLDTLDPANPPLDVLETLEQKSLMDEKE